MFSFDRKKLLAINFGGIGDEILFLPVLETVRKNYPNLEITLLLEPRSRAVTQVTDLVDQTLTFDIKKRPLLASDLVDLLGLIRQGDFDFAISSGSSPLVSLLLFLSGIRQRIGYDSSILARALLTKAVPLNKEQYAAGMYHDLIAWVEPDKRSPKPKIIVSQEALANARAILGNGNDTAGDVTKIILIHPGSSRLAIKKGIIKTWSTDNWAALITKLATLKKVHVVLAGGPDDPEIIESILTKLPSGLAFSSVYGKTKNLSDLAGLIKLSDLMVCVDSAPMHIAVGLNKKLVALFGPTDPKKLLPKDDNFVALRGNPPLRSGSVNVAVDIVFDAVERQLDLR